VSNETAVSFSSCRHEKPGSRKCLSSKECYFLFVVTLGWSVINSLDCWRENSIYFQWKINRQLLSSSLLYLVCIYKMVLCVCVCVCVCAYILPYGLSHDYSNFSVAAAHARTHRQSCRWDVPFRHHFFIHVPLSFFRESLNRPISSTDVNLIQVSVDSFFRPYFFLTIYHEDCVGWSLTYITKP
jgi:hypothetical protein